MKTLEFGDRVKYIGVTNTWTFEQDLTTNSKGKVVNIIPSGGKENYEVEFENGIITTVDIEDLEIEI